MLTVWSNSKRAQFNPRADPGGESRCGPQSTAQAPIPSGVTGFLHQDPLPKLIPTLRHWVMTFASFLL